MPTERKEAAERGVGPSRATGPAKKLHALLLAAGLSTRLGALSEQRPKPLLPVCNHSLLCWAAHHCRAAGIEDLVVNLHHLGEQIEAELADGASLGLRVRYSREPAILGTGGGIRQMAAMLPRGRCLVANAKIVTDLDLEELLAFHERAGALATLVVRPDENAERWGAIHVDETSGRVTRILDTSAPGAPGEDAEAPPRQFTGIHVLEPELVDAIPDAPPTVRCVIRTAYQKLLTQGALVAGYLHRGYFYDHSTPARYLQGNLNLLAGAAAPSHAPGPLAGVDPGAEIHRTAKVHQEVLVGAGARVEADVRLGPGVVVGPGARVSRGARLEASIVWPGVTADRSGSRLVFTPRGPVEIPAAADPAASPR
jgi:NDP-sugar pyrophosphorylase family protein